MDKPLLSVIIPNYNYAQYLGQCLQSVLDSDFDKEKLEIVIVDDASTDESVNMIEEMMKGSRFPIRLIKNETNLGLVLSRNRGMVNARGEFLFFLDSDNYLRADCIKTHLNTIIQNPDAVACYAPIQDFLDKTGEHCGLRSNHPFEYEQLINAPYIDAMAMFRKNELIEAGMYDTSMPPYGWEDYELWLRLGKLGRKVVFIGGEPLSFYRIHQLNKSLNYKPDQNNHLIYYLRQKYPVKLVLQPSEVLDSLVFHKEYFAQLFCQSQNSDFSEFDSVRIEITGNPLQFNLPPDKSYSRLRFDPKNDYVVVNLKSVRFFGTQNEMTLNYHLTSNACEVAGSTFYFANSDPQIFIDLGGAFNIQKVVIDADYLATGIRVFEVLERIIKEGSEKNSKLEKQLAQHNQGVVTLNEGLAEQTQQLQSEISKLTSRAEVLRNEIANSKQSLICRLARKISGFRSKIFS